jgi:hypothetical protein
MPYVKELHYFNERYVENNEMGNYRSKKGLGWYLSHFPKNGVRGEFCPAYLWDRKAPERIHASFPEIKIIISIRNPVDRAFSQYLYYVKRGIIKQDFETALKERPDLIERGIYINRIQRYFELFTSQQILIILFDEIKTNPQKILKNIYSFLKVDPLFKPVRLTQKSNEARSPLFPRINQLLTVAKHWVRERPLCLKFIHLCLLDKIGDSIQNLNTRSLSHTPEIKPSTRSALIETFIPSIEKLEAFLKVDLSEWEK